MTPSAKLRADARHNHAAVERLEIVYDGTAVHRGNGPLQYVTGILLMILEVVLDIRDHLTRDPEQPC